MKIKDIKKYITILAVSVCVMSVLSACGNDKKTSDKQEVTADEADDLESNDTVGNEADKIAKEEKKEEAGEEKEAERVEEKPAVSAMDSIKAYQRFLNNSEKVYSDKYLQDKKSQQGYFESSPFTNIFLADNGMTFADFLEKFCKEMSKEWESPMRPDDISYSYIDCGNDGIPELALKFAGEDSKYLIGTDLFIIKLMEDSRLQFIFYDEFGYRSYGDLNEYGYYSNGGANSASSYMSGYSYIDAESNVRFLYMQEYEGTIWGFYAPGGSEAVIAKAKEFGIADNIEIIGTSFKDFYNQDYDEYLKACMWNYYEIDENFDLVEESAEDIYDKSSKYRQVWDCTGLKLNTEKEIEDAIKAREAEYGVTDTIKNGRELDWINISEKQYDEVYNWIAREVQYIRPDNPKWDYYCKEDKGAKTKASLTKTNQTSNDITDDYKWFDMLGIAEPDRLEFCDDTYRYKLSGMDSSNLQWYPYIMDVCDFETGEVIYNIDFSDYYIPDSYAAGDYNYVEESVHWAEYDDGVLYVSTFHNTYASSAPHNGYITAFDVNNNFEVLWRSRPLTINSNNFVIDDDAIYCGYGFTAEDDFVYVLDKKSGERMQTIKVKTGPDWFAVRDNTLYVRCYDTDYEFLITR